MVDAVTFELFRFLVRLVASLWLCSHFTSKNIYEMRSENIFTNHTLAIISMCRSTDTHRFSSHFGPVLTRLVVYFSFKVTRIMRKTTKWKTFFFTRRCFILLSIYFLCLATFSNRDITAFHIHCAIVGIFDVIFVVVIATVVVNDIVVITFRSVFVESLTLCFLFQRFSFLFSRFSFAFVTPIYFND